MTSKQSKTNENPVSEVRRIRDAHAKKFNYDLRAIFEDFLRFEREQNLKRVGRRALAACLGEVAYLDLTCA